jgi:uncharacterized protein YaaR (DUF327 family)
MGIIEKTQTDLTHDEKLKIKAKKRSRVHHGTSGGFVQTLESSINFEFQGSIDELMNDLKDQERKFLDSQTQYELQRYKSLVQKILKTILDEGYKTGTIKRQRRDRADFTIVEKINTRLLEMSAAVTRHNKAFDLLKTIEEIRGLLLDLEY